MNSNTLKANPQSHTWREAAEQITTKGVDKAFLQQLRESGLPGTDNVGDDGSWPSGNRIEFLKLFCGEDE